MEITSNIGRRCRIIVRLADGKSVVWTGKVLREDELSITILTDRKEEQTEPKATASISWMTKEESG
jgi:hypothetical protein